MRRRNGPVVKNDVLLLNNADSVQVGSRRWFAWLADHSSFVFEGKAGHLAARRETRRSNSYWYGYRWRDGKLCKSYLGKSEELTQERLERVSRRLAGQSKLALLSASDESTDWVTPPTISPHTSAGSPISASAPISRPAMGAWRSWPKASAMPSSSPQTRPNSGIPAVGKVTPHRHSSTTRGRDFSRRTVRRSGLALCGSHRFAQLGTRRWAMKITDIKTFLVGGGGRSPGLVVDRLIFGTMEKVVHRRWGTGAA